VTAGAQQLPRPLPFSPSPVWADPQSTGVRLLVMIQNARFRPALTLAAHLSDAVSLPYLIAVALLRRVITSFDTPTRHAFLLSYRPPLGSAQRIALQSMLFQCTRSVDRPVAGLMPWASAMHGASSQRLVLSRHHRHLPAVRVPSRARFPRPG